MNVEFQEAEDTLHFTMIKYKPFLFSFKCPHI